MTRMERPRKHPLDCDHCKKIGFGGVQFYKDNGKLYCKKCAENIIYEINNPGICTS